MFRGFAVHIKRYYTVALLKSHMKVINGVIIYPCF